MAEPTSAASRAMPEHLKYVPGKTLGRSGYLNEPGEQLGRRISQLDALLCVMSGEEDEDGMTDFRRLNNTIQQTVLDLASQLATEIHELHTQLTLADARRRLGFEPKEASHV